MKPKWVATPYAGKFKTVFQCIKNIGPVFFMILVLIIISCDKSDDLQIIGVEPPPVNESPTNESVIIYTDVEPDFISEELTDLYDLDLNNDQIIDFIIRADGADEGWVYLGITSNSNDANGIISVAPWYTYAIPLNSGQEIFNLRGYRNGEFYATWGFLYECVTVEQNCSPHWEDKGVDGYLGLRFIINGRTHYGWVQLNVTNVTQWAIIDYAFNATPDKPILAGQKK